MQIVGIDDLAQFIPGRCGHLSIPNLRWSEARTPTQRLSGKGEIIDAACECR
jgi:hypothetical protein